MPRPARLLTNAYGLPSHTIDQEEGVDDTVLNRLTFVFYPDFILSFQCESKVGAGHNMPSQDP